MKRYVCTVAAGFVLALMGTATASANGLPVPGQEATQEATQVTSFGDQSVGEQKNDADVTQSQGNGNLNLSPAIGLGGDATTTNEQGNGNVAKSDIDQENEVEQSQDSTQKQTLDQNGSSGNCCTDQSQSGEQKTYGGDQSVEEQKNDADVTQKQGNGNVNIAPAIAVFGDAETTNKQGNDNVAKSDIDQENEVEQSQDSTQKQHLGQDGGSCCESGGYDRYENGEECGCDSGQSQTGEQKTSFGDQWVGKQKNDADVNQWQGNGKSTSHLRSPSSVTRRPRTSRATATTRNPTSTRRTRSSSRRTRTSASPSAAKPGGRGAAETVRARPASSASTAVTSRWRSRRTTPT